MKVFNKIKVSYSYRIVGQTHEDPDQSFSHMHWQIFQKAGSDDFVCSCFYCCHNDLLQHSYQHPKVCGEHFFLLRHNKSAENSWQGLCSFDLPEETLDKCHDFVVQRKKEGRACLQYKHKRYSDALLPRKFDVGGTYYSPTNGIGTVIQCSPEKDVITKEKFWNYTIRYEPDNALLIPAFQIPRC